MSQVIAPSSIESFDWKYFTHVTSFTKCTRSHAKQTCKYENNVVPMLGCLLNLIRPPSTDIGRGNPFTETRVNVVT